MISEVSTISSHIVTTLLTLYPEIKRKMRGRGGVSVGE